MTKKGLHLRYSQSIQILVRNQLESVVTGFETNPTFGLNLKSKDFFLSMHWLCSAVVGANTKSVKPDSKSHQYSPLSLTNPTGLTNFSSPTGLLGPHEFL